MTIDTSKAIEWTVMWSEQTFAEVFALQAMDVRKELCPICGGTGIARSTTRYYRACMRCVGTGWVRLEVRH